MNYSKLNTPKLSYGPVRPKYRPNDINDPPVVWSTTEYITSCSDDAASSSLQLMYGGASLYPIKVAVHAKGSTTSVVQDIPLNTLGNTLHGTAAGDQSEPVGITHDTNPPAITQFASAYKFARVVQTTVDVVVTNASGDNQALELFALIYRSDLGIPAGFTPGGASQPANIQQTPGLIKWVSKKNAIAGDINPNPMRKRLTFDIPKWFNDVEWAYDNPAATASTTNFWVEKDGNNLFTATPNVQLRMRLYGRFLLPDNDVGTNINCGLRMHHKVEFHRGQTVLPAPAAV